MKPGKNVDRLDGGGTPLIPVVGERDILEWRIRDAMPEVLDNLLIDRTMTAANGCVTNIKWATDDYARQFPGDTRFAADRQILPDLVCDRDHKLICPRVDKRLDEQRRRSVEKAEVFTPSWVCNAQNNLIDCAWFGRKTSPFNIDRPNVLSGMAWTSTRERKVNFPKRLGKTWQEYVRALRLEVSCGEAPYLTSRYDTTSGKWIEPAERIGLLDRKLRVIGENVGDDRGSWLLWAEVALRSVYGFEWQGDNVLIARENLLYAVLEEFAANYGWGANGSEAYVPPHWVRRYAEIISWNIWQMDGIKFVVPNSCKDVHDGEMMPGFEQQFKKCEGCAKGLVEKHNGERCRVMDWEEGRQVLFMPPFDFKPIVDKENA